MVGSAAIHLTGYYMPEYGERHWTCQRGCPGSQRRWQKRWYLGAAVLWCSMGESLAGRHATHTPSLPTELEGPSDDEDEEHPMGQLIGYTDDGLPIYDGGFVCCI